MSGTRRLFFALWPDPAARASLMEATVKAVGDSGGRPVRAENLHVTLAFLGAVPEERVRELRGVASACAQATIGATLSLRFASLEIFPRQQVLCAITAPAQALQQLAAALRDGCAAAGFSPDFKPFRPHVTLARKITRQTAPGTLRTVVWSFAGFVLVASQTHPSGPVYSVLDSFALGDST